MLKWGDVYLDNKTGQVCKYFPCHAGQLEVLQSKASYIAALGGKNGGKTSVAMLWLMQEIQRLGGRNAYLVLGPSYSVLLDATLPAFAKTVEGTVLEGSMHRNTQNPHYLLGTGGVVSFRSADAKWEGAKPSAIVIDEAGDVSEDIFIKAKGRLLNQQGGRIFLSTTPYLTHDWINRVVIQNADKNNPAYFYRSFASWMNPGGDLEKIKEAKRELPEWRFQMDYCGIFNRMPGLVYDFTDADGQSCFVDVPSSGLPEAAAYFGAIDWGGTDPHVFLVGLLDTNDVLWVFTEHYKAGDTLALFEHLNDWHNAFKKTTGDNVRTWYCDHRKDSILSLRRMGLNAKPAPKGPESIPLGIGLVQSRIRTGRLKIISSECPNTKAESLLYRYPMADGMAVGNKPIDADNHALDALRYMVLGIDRKQVAKQLAKPD